MRRALPRRWSVGAGALVLAVCVGTGMAAPKAEPAIDEPSGYLRTRPLRRRGSPTSSASCAPRWNRSASVRIRPPLPSEVAALRGEVTRLSNAEADLERRLGTRPTAHPGHPDRARAQRRGRLRPGVRVPRARCRARLGGQPPDATLARPSPAHPCLICRGGRHCPGPRQLIAAPDEVSEAFSGSCVGRHAGTAVAPAGLLRTNGGKTYARNRKEDNGATADADGWPSRSGRSSCMPPMHGRRTRPDPEDRLRRHRLDADVVGAGPDDDGPGLALFYGGLVRTKNVLNLLPRASS